MKYEMSMSVHPSSLDGTTGGITKAMSFQLSEHPREMAGLSSAAKTFLKVLFLQSTMSYRKKIKSNDSSDR